MLMYTNKCTALYWVCPVNFGRALILCVSCIVRTLIISQAANYEKFTPGMEDLENSQVIPHTASWRTKTYVSVCEHTPVTGLFSVATWCSHESICMKMLVPFLWSSWITGLFMNFLYFLCPAPDSMTLKCTSSWDHGSRSMSIVWPWQHHIHHNDGLEKLHQCWCHDLAEVTSCRALTKSKTSRTQHTL